MLARLSILWQDLRNSLRGLPIDLVICGAAGAILTLQLHLVIPPARRPVWWLYSADPSTASNFLANLQTAMITKTTLAISITIVRGWERCRYAGDSARRIVQKTPLSACQVFIWSKKSALLFV